MPERLTVFGGEGHMGKVVVHEARQQGHEVIVVDPTAEVQINPIIAINNSTVIYFSLFPEDLISVLDKHGAQIQPGQIVMDNCTVKTPIIPILRDLDQRGISTVSTHPLAKHDQPLRGVKVLVMDVGNNSEKARNFAEDFYRKSGMIIIDQPLSEHDIDMNPEQGLPHTLWQALAQTIADHGYKPDRLWSLAPANAELFWLAAWRTWVQNSKLKASIVGNFLKNPSGKALIETYIKNLQKLIEIAEDEKALEETITATHKRLNTNGMGEEMNEKSTIVLERLANLRMGSMVIIALKDEPAVLKIIVDIFAETGINMTAIDSHQLPAGVKFMIGEDPKTETSALNQAKLLLRESGFRVDEIQKPQ